MEIKLPKREEIKNRYREERSESPMESMIFEKLAQRGLRFDRQFKVGSFFADLARPDIMVAIEYDGQEYHKDKDKDRNRIKYFNERGWKVFSLEKFTGSVYQLSEDGNMVSMDMEIDNLLNRIEEEVILRSYRIGKDIKKECSESKGFSKLADNFSDFYDRIDEKYNGIKNIKGTKVK